MIGQFTYVQSLVEKNVVADLPRNVALQANQSSTVVGDSTFQDTQISNIRIQNTGANSIYVAYGVAASAIYYHYVLDSHQVLEVDVCQTVNVFSTVAGSVSVLTLRRLANYPLSSLQ